MGSPIRVDVLCLGIACYDLIFTVDRDLGPDEKVVATDFTACGGGTAANAAVAVARLGWLAAYAGYLGQDLYGDLHMQELAAAGVNTELVVRGAAPTSLSAIAVKPNGTKSLVNYRGNAQPLPAESVELARCEPRVILLDGHHIRLAQALLALARRRAIPTVLDADTVRPETLALLPVVDYVVASERFARDYSGQAEPAEALAQLGQVAPQVVITLGERGLIWRTPSDDGAVPAFPVTVVDSTGAGDAFHGAFAAGLAGGMAWPLLLRFASAVGALCCTVPGARLGLPNRAEVERLMAEMGGAFPAWATPSVPGRA